MSFHPRGQKTFKPPSPQLNLCPGAGRLKHSGGFSLWECKGSSPPPHRCGLTDCHTTWSLYSAKTRPPPRMGVGCSITQREAKQLVYTRTNTLVCRIRASSWSVFTAQWYARLGHNPAVTQLCC